MPICRLQIPFIENDDDTSDVQITNVEYLGSFDWIESTEPTILVPGFPPRWRDRNTPYQLLLDPPSPILDQTGHRLPSARTLPLFAAVDTQTESFDWASVDLITDRNCLRKLLRWVSGQEREFRIDTHVLGTTVIFNRWESNTVEDFDFPHRGYGHSFEEYSTVRPCQSSVSHSRIIQYDFGGLKLVVGFEMDAYLLTATIDQQESEESWNAVDVSHFPFTTIPVDNDGTGLKVLRGGHVVPQETIIELKSRGIMNATRIDWSEVIPQLLFAQTTNLFLGVHKRGNLLEVRKLSDVGFASEKAEMLQSELRRLRRALGAIRNLAIERAGKEGEVVSLVFSGGQMKVYRRKKDDTALPEYLRKKYM